MQIQGWTRIKQPIAGSVDGLLVVDTLGGEPLALRITDGAEWRQFTCYRAAGHSGQMAVTFALCGLGEAWIDDVTIQVLGARRVEPAQAQRTPPANLDGAPRP